MACGDVEEGRRDRVVTSVDARTLGAKAPTKRFAGGLAVCLIQRAPDVVLVRDSEVTRIARLETLPYVWAGALRRDRVITSVDV